MRTGLSAFSLATLLALAPSLGTAQTTDGTSDDTTANQSIEDQLSFGDGEVQVGQPYTSEVIGDWEMRCIKTEEGEDPCQMYQLLQDAEEQPVAEFTLFRLPEGGRAMAGATLIVPLETALPNQVSISIDGQQPRRYPYAFCNPVGCYARIGLTPQDVDAYKAGNAATITIVPALAPDQQVELTLSLRGFTASFDQVSIIEQQ